MRVTCGAAKASLETLCGCLDALHHHERLNLAVKYIY